jgi:hypothetical protein
MDFDAALASVEAALANSEARLSVELGGHRESTTARLWQGRVLVDWEPDNQAGDCLLRPQLLRRLVTLGAHPRITPGELRLAASGPIVSALTQGHAELVRQLGGARRIELTIVMSFTDGRYVGGRETYFLIQRGHHVPLMRIDAELRAASSAPEVSPRTSPASR